MYFHGIWIKKSSGTVVCDYTWLAVWPHGLY